MENQDESSLFDKIRDNTQDGIAEALKEAKTILTKFILIAEIMEEDGDRVLWRVATDGMTSWEALGMIESARLIEEKTNYAE